MRNLHLASQVLLGVIGTVIGWLAFGYTISYGFKLADRFEERIEPKISNRLHAWRNYRPKLSLKIPFRSKQNSAAS